MTQRAAAVTGQSQVGGDCDQADSAAVRPFVNRTESNEAMDPSLRQRGFINFGGGMARQAWIDAAERDGYVVRDRGDFAELWNPATQSEKASGK